MIFFFPSKRHEYIIGRSERSAKDARAACLCVCVCLCVGERHSPESPYTLNTADTFGRSSLKKNGLLPVRRGRWRRFFW